MKYVDSGNGKVPLISLIAILSISLTVNLPGLAVSPLLGKLQSVFPHVTELESQLLTILPNFVIIPFILFSGKITTPKNKMTVLFYGLLIYLAAAVLFLFAKSMAMLIILSCVLGVGCGLIIPLAASLIAVNFYGASRTKYLGMKSGISNFTVIFATLFVGWIASIGWHLAFLVYLVPLVPLALIPFMRDDYIAKHRVADPSKPLAANTGNNDTEHPSMRPAVKYPSAEPESIAPTSNFKTVMILFGIIGLYVSLTYGTEVVSYYLPFTMKHYGMTTAEVGLATSLFFLAATLAGFSLPQFIRIFGRATPYVCIALCVISLYAIGFVHSYAVIIAAVFVMGYGYGIMQPIIYDKTAFIAPTAEKANAYFAYTLTGNYIAIAMVPFIVDLFAKIFRDNSVDFSYILNGSILLLVLGIAFVKSKSLVFTVSRNKY